MTLALIDNGSAGEREVNVEGLDEGVAVGVALIDSAELDDVAAVTLAPMDWPDEREVDVFGVDDDFAVGESNMINAEDLGVEVDEVCDRGMSVGEDERERHETIE